MTVFGGVKRKLGRSATEAERRPTISFRAVSDLHSPLKPVADIKQWQQYVNIRVASSLCIHSSPKTSIYCQNCSRHMQSHENCLGLHHQTSTEPPLPKPLPTSEREFRQVPDPPPPPPAVPRWWSACRCDTEMSPSLLRVSAAPCVP